MCVCVRACVCVRVFSVKVSVYADKVYVGLYVRMCAMHVRGGVCMCVCMYVCVHVCVCML